MPAQKVSAHENACIQSRHGSSEKDLSAQLCNVKVSVKIIRRIAFAPYAHYYLLL